MEYHYGYDGIPISDEKCRKTLHDDLERAKKRLDAYCKALGSPVGSSAWEGAMHSSDTIESLRENVRQAKIAYQNYNGT